MKGKTLRQFLDRIPRWPKEAQDELLRSMAEIETRYSNTYQVNDEERAALERSAEDVRKNGFAADENVDAVFGRFHRA
jgi:hypothetical protein